MEAELPGPGPGEVLFERCERGVLPWQKAPRQSTLRTSLWDLLDLQRWSAGAVLVVQMLLILLGWPQARAAIAL